MNTFEDFTTPQMTTEELIIFNIELSGTLDGELLKVDCLLSPYPELE